MSTRMVPTSKTMETFSRSPCDVVKRWKMSSAVEKLLRGGDLMCPGHDFATMS